MTLGWSTVKLIKRIQRETQELTNIKAFLAIVLDKISLI